LSEDEMNIQTVQAANVRFSFKCLNIYIYIYIFKCCTAEIKWVIYLMLFALDICLFLNVDFFGTVFFHTYIWSGLQVL